MQRSSSTGLAYLPGLDGLRALAVLAVIFFHSGLNWLPGGFLGVEVFFVISGFIITAGLRKEQAAGGISLRHFWKRRALRLLPAVIFLLFTVVAYAEIFEPGKVAGLAGDSVAALAYVTNWYLIVDGQSYFGGFEEPSMLRHLWSLAIEEQFYVAWPLIAMAGFALLPRKLFASSLVLLGLGSALLMAILFESGADPSRLYYGTDTRASGLLLGAALALTWQPGIGGRVRRWRVHSIEVAGLFALLGLGATSLLLTESSGWLYRGGFLAVDTLTIVTIVAATYPAARLGPWVGILPMRWIGLRSYGLYLWHWPIILIVAPSWGWVGGQHLEFVVELAATFVVAEASFRWIEQPIRRGALGRIWTRHWGSRGTPSLARAAHATGAFGVVVAVVAVGGTALKAQPPEQPDYFALGHIRITPEVQQQETASVSGVSYYASGGFTTPEDLEHLSIEMRELFEDAARIDTETADESPAEDDEQVDSSPVNEAPVAPTPEPSSAARAGVYVTAVGDSVMLGAAREMGAAVDGIDVDAQVSRSLGAAIAILEDRKARGILADTVVLHIGNNGPVTDEQIDRVAEIVGDRRTIILSLRVPRWWEAENNQVLIRGAGRYGFEMLDWQAASGERPEILWTDGIHLRPAGAVFYTELLTEKLAHPPTPPEPVLSEIELPGGFARP